MNDSILNHHLVPNCFAPTSYFDLDVRAGVMRNRFGAKCCSLSGHFLRGLYVALQHEAGPAWRSILRHCGESWGTRFAQRFLREVGQFYGQSLEEMSMLRFDALVRECFAVHGWGRMQTDFSRLDAGVIQIEVANPVMSEALGIAEARTEVLLEGVLKSLFREVTDQPLECYETQSAALGATSSIFILAHEKRMAAVPGLIEAGETHATILERVLSEKLGADK